MKSLAVSSLVFVTLLATSCRTGADEASALKDDPVAGGRAAQLFRFDPWLDTMREAVQGSDAEAVADDLIGGPQRVASYNLQALGRLYASENDRFKEIKSDFKDMEDGIGAYDKWTNVLKKAQQSGASAEVIEKLTKKKKKAMEDLVEMLTVGGWVVPAGEESRIESTQGFLDGFAWKAYADDREMMLGKLADELGKLKNTTYDMGVLEEGDGLHELRRDWKWIAIELRVLNGMVTFRPDSQVCPVDAYQDLVNQPIAQSKYAKLPLAATEVDPCRIAQCLYVGLAELIEDLGALKDKAEQIINAQPGEPTDEVPEEIRADAEAVYAKLVQRDLAGQMAGQLQACQVNPTPITEPTPDADTDSTP